MLVLSVSVALLLGAPALLLLLGRLIERQTDLRKRETSVAAACSGTEWYFRAPASLVGRAEVPKAMRAEPAWPEVSGPMDDAAWFRRPLAPLFGGFPWARPRRRHA